MFDAKIRPLIDPVLNAQGARLAARGVSVRIRSHWQVWLLGFLRPLLDCFWSHGMGIGCNFVVTVGGWFGWRGCAGRAAK